MESGRGKFPIVTNCFVTNVNFRDAFPLIFLVDSIADPAAVVSVLS